jgi:hypothetical protein
MGPEGGGDILPPRTQTINFSPLIVISLINKPNSSPEIYHIPVFYRLSIFQHFLSSP